MQYCCAAIGLAHLILEWALFAASRFCSAIWAFSPFLLGLALAESGLCGCSPSSSELHHIKYYGATQPGAGDEADRAFSKLGTALLECGNLLVIGGLLFISAGAVSFWSGNHARFGNLNLDVKIQVNSIAIEIEIK